MISVQNHLQRLSGNKFFFFAIFISLIFSSCDTVRIASKPVRSRSDKKVHRKKRPVVKVDTVEWKKDPSEHDAPISDDLPFDYGYDIASEKKSIYKVSLLMPIRSKMNLNRSKWSRNSLRFINYYGGMKLAMKDLKLHGVNIDVAVYDSEYSFTKVKKLWSNADLKKSDLIIGPYHKKALIFSAEKAKKHKLTLLSPWISSPSITDNNPYYIQSRSGLLKHYHSILLNAYHNFDMEQIYVLIKQGDDTKRKEIEEVFATISSNLEIESLNFLDVLPDTVEYGTYVVDTLLMMKHPVSAFILPYSSSKDKEFIYDFVQKFELLKKENLATLYGLYKWLDYSEDMHEYFNRMDIRLSMNGIVDPTNVEIIKFKERYFKAYGAFPTKDAFEGYDLMYYAGIEMDKKGNKFHIMNDDKKQLIGLQTAFNIKPKFSLKEGADRKTLGYYENGFIQVIGCEEYKYIIYN